MSAMGELAAIATLLMLVLLTIIADTMLYRVFGVKYTISDVLRRAGAAYPLLPFIVAMIFGALFGHFFLCPIADAVSRSFAP